MGEVTLVRGSTGNQYTVSGNDERVVEAIQVLDRGAQRQDSFSDQKTDSLALIRAAGCEDFLEHILQLMGRS